MRNALLVARNVLRVTFRAPSKMVIYFVLPVLGIVLSLFMSFERTGTVRIGVLDEDGGRFSRELVQAVAGWGGYSLTPIGAADLEPRLTRGSLDVALVIPAGWSDGIRSGGAPRVRLVSIKGTEVTGLLSEVVDLFGASVARIAAAAGSDSSRFETMYAAATAGGAGLDVQKLPDLSSGKRVTLSSLGFLVYFILLGSGTTMQLVLAERRDRTYMRIRTAPVRGLNYIEGHGLASFFIIVAQVVAALIIMKFAFRIETFVPDFLLFLILLLFGLTAVGVSLAITAFSRSSQVATILINLILTPTSMIAGCFWPASIMPPFLQRIALFLPQRWVLDVIQKAQTGAGAGALGLDLLVIAGFAVVLFLLAGYRFARIEEQGQFV